MRRPNSLLYNGKFIILNTSSLHFGFGNKNGSSFKSKSESLLVWGSFNTVYILFQINSFLFKSRSFTSPPTDLLKYTFLVRLFPLTLYTKPSLPSTSVPQYALFFLLPVIVYTLLRVVFFVVV